MRDTALVLDAVAGPGPGDPYTAPPPARPFREEVGADPGRLRIGLRTRRRDGGASEPDCVRAVARAGELLASLGHHVEEVDIPALDAPVDDAFGIVMCVAVARDLARWRKRTGVELTDDDVEPGNLMLANWRRISARLRRRPGRKPFGGELRVPGTIIQHVISDRRGVLLGETADEADEAVGTRMGNLVSFTSPFDITGQPAISLPLYWNDAHLPIGVQLAAAYGREDVLLRIGAQLEAAAPWCERHPPSVSER